MNRKEFLKHVLIGGAMVGVAVGTLFAVKKVREMHAQKLSASESTPDVTYDRPAAKKADKPTKKPIKVKLIEDEDDE